MFYSEVRHQLQFENQPIDVDTETDAEEGAVGPQEREKLIVKIPLGKVKGKKKKTASPKTQSTKGVGGNKCGGGGHCGCGHGRGQSNGTSTSTENNNTSNVTASKHGCR